MPRNVPHAWKNTGSEPARALFLYTPAAAGGLVEELSERRPSNPEDFRTYSFERVLADIRDARDRDQAKVFSPRESPVVPS
jgi:hypothetical protein